ncbi:triacylglycerol lipase OBL1 isoform X2 [Beta vulgaris subsp. vulgaris]|uniref:triacylglycerol lipase OBL1 isoform X2 n=1 Tax=Beta vulgaris subsp. vulgaris TaxID=3555 RepID=UPI002546E7B4|nr:triacylglycerol lipase OBL1 isoform X2 [Beta vulgaris subsp. vulgaris]
MHAYPYYYYIHIYDCITYILVSLIEFVSKTIEDKKMNGRDEWKYMIIRPEKAGVGDLWRFWRKGDIESGSKFIKSNYEEDYYGILDIEKWSLMFEGKDNRWVIVVSVIARKLIKGVAKPMEFIGYFVDFLLNLLALNGNLFGLFINFLRDYQQEMSTQVFILCDKPVNADCILISFRGTEPYDADDWSTDFDYSWYEIPELGKLHMGFLEALGLGNRADTQTFRHNLQQKNIRVASAPEMAELTAYIEVKTKLKDLLEEHKNAKFVVTGHSLGGALAILFPTVLILHEESEMIKRLLGVYTFGQPRIGDAKLGRFIEEQLNKPELRYFRVVYCNDVVPRLPYDDKTFLYKHFGICLYYNSFYTQQKVEEEPNKNFYGIRYLIPAHVNAAWELIRALMMGYLYGVDYQEDWYSIFVRVVGLVLPGISAHSPRDYVNSVRLGREYAVQMSSFD